VHRHGARPVRRRGRRGRVRRLIADLHLDVLLDVFERRAAGDADPFGERHLPALREAGVRIQVLPAFVPDEFLPGDALRVTIAQLEVAHREAERPDGALRIVRDRAELREALESGAIAGVLALEGVEALGDDPELLRPLHRLGVRMAGLTWNRANAYADGLGVEVSTGLTALGERLLGEMEELAIGLDISHLSRRGCERALDAFGGTVLASHANAAAVHASPRNLDDDVLAAIGRRGGVVGLCATPAFTGTGPFAEMLARHHAHICAVAGVEAVAFGADFCDFFGPSLEAPLLPDPPGEADLALARQPEPERATFYAEVLSAAGEPDGGPLAAGNALRVLDRVLA
jgi:membrane dipeptidase